MTNYPPNQSTQHSCSDSPPTISIVIPAFFRDPTNPALVEGFRRFFGQFSQQGYRSFDIFLSDSGPSESQGIVQELIKELLEEEYSWLSDKVTVDYVVTEGAPLSRAEAMNHGVQQTSGELILFLHVDCVLPQHGLSSLVDAYLHGVKAGGFLKRYMGKELMSPLQLTERYLNWVRTVVTRQMVGTNAIFMTRDVAMEHPFQGSFLEDVEMSDWLRKHIQRQAFSIVRKYVTVSAKKYQKQGEIRSIAINASVMTLYRLFSIEPELLKEHIYFHKFPEGWSFWTTLWNTWSTLIRENKHDPS